VLKYGSDTVISLAIKHLLPLASFDDEISSVVGAKALIQMGSKVTSWKNSEDIDLICWLLDHKLVQLSDFNFRDLLWVCVKSEKRRKLLKLWDKFDEKSLIEHCFDFIDVHDIVDLTFDSKKHSATFFDQCFDELKNLPSQSHIDDKIQSIMYFAYKTNSPLIFRILIKYGYHLDKSYLLNVFRNHYHDFGMVLWLNKYL
jgi:hypothetical protein